MSRPEDATPWVFSQPEGTRCETRGGLPSHERRHPPDATRSRHPMQYRIMMRKAARIPGRRNGGLLPPRHRRSERPARRPHGRATGRGLPARIEDVGLQAHRAAEDPRHKDRETAACQERRAGRDAPCHGQRHLIGLPMAARPLARDTCHIATTPGLDAPFCVPNCRLKEPAGEHLFLIKLYKTRARPSGSRPYKTRRFSMCPLFTRRQAERQAMPI